ncbi:hypothetical protein WN943_014224 [Citrus x changshan-huyou]
MAGRSGWQAKPEPDSRGGKKTRVRSQHQEPGTRTVSNFVKSAPRDIWSSSQLQPAATAPLLSHRLARLVIFSATATERRRQLSSHRLVIFSIIGVIYQPQLRCHSHQPFNSKPE